MSSTFSQASAVSASDSNEPGCEPSRSVRSTPSADESSPSTGPTSPATTTCEVLPLTGSQQMELLPMSSVAGSPARTSASQEKAQALKAAAAVYGQNTPELLANYDPASSSWRTSQFCLDGALTEFSETWPRSGLMRNGTAYQLPPLVPLTDEIASGLWLTPTKVERWCKDETEIVTTRNGTKRRRYKNGKTSSLGLTSQVMMSQRSAEIEDGEIGQMLRFPTPNARDYKGAPGQGTRERGGHQSSLPASIKELDGSGSLNPTWVEWLMGFPIEWTVLAPSVTQSSRKSRKSSGGQS
jgi:hypothetical protein